MSKIEKNNLKNVLRAKNRQEFRNWLAKNCNSEDECWAIVKMGKPNDGDGNLYYIDAVYEALCFGWIDSSKKKIGNSVYQRFSPRKKNSYWSELNKARFYALTEQGLMTENGKKNAPNYDFKIDEDIAKILKSDKKLFDNFMSFSNLYKRIRICNIQRERKNKQVFEKSLNNFIKQTKEGKMYGNWDDYGLLREYENSFEFKM